MKNFYRMNSKLPFVRFLLVTFVGASILIATLVLGWKSLGHTLRFNLVILLIALHYVFLFLALLLLLLRLFKFPLSNKGVIYILVCTLNILTGLFSVGFYFFQKTNIWWLNQTLLNLLFGLIMILDMFVFQDKDAIS